MRFTSCLAACLVLVSCATRQVQPTDGESAASAFRQREQALAALTAWDLAGRLSIDDGAEGGSGRLGWKIRGDASEMTFRGAMGRGSWQLSSGPGYAELQRSDGSLSRGDSADELVHSEVGWQVPVNALRWWALGLPAPGGVELMDLDAAGRVLALQQAGWHIHYERYRSFGDVELPGRMDAVRGQYRVKMAVSDWVVSAPPR